MKRSAAALVSLLSACGTTLEDQGRACVSTGADPYTAGDLAAGRPVTIHVVMPTCLSSSCTSDRQASCTVSQEGSTLRVSSRGSYASRPAAVCTDDCVRLTAHCETAPLPAGQYTIVHGGATTTLSIPGGVAQAPCP